MTNALAQQFREGGNTSLLRDVEVFASGVHRDKLYTPEDLDQVVANFNLHSSGNHPKLAVPMAIPKLMPGAPAVLGHEEEQKILEGSDLPAAGWPISLRHDRKAGKLIADVSGVAPVVAKAIAGKRYRKVSAEIYDHPPEGIPGSGKMLRRISFLGADVPQVKSLADLPMPEPDTHSEQFAPFQSISFKCLEVVQTPGKPGCYTCFFEGNPSMDRDSVIQQLQDLGCDTSTLDNVPDEGLAEMLRVCQSYANSNKSKFDDMMPMDGDLPDPANDDEAQQYADKWRKWGERAKMGLQKYCAVDQSTQTDPTQKMSADQTVNALTATAKPGEKPMDKFSEEIQSLIKTEIATVTSSLKKAKEEFESYREQSAIADRQAMVRKEFAGMGPLGSKQLSAADLDEGSPISEISQALRHATSTAVVHKFTEKGKEVCLTELDCQLRRLKSKPAMKFSEVGKATGKVGDASVDDDVAKVESHFEQFRENFPKNQTKENFVAGFKAARKHNAGLTAEKFLS